MPVWRTGAYGWEGAAGRTSYSFRRMMLKEASPQMCVSILSCLEAESLIGKWFPYPERQKNKRLLELSHSLPLICCRMTQALPSFSFLWLSSCLPVYQVPEWKRQMCAVIVRMYCLTFRVAVKKVPDRDDLWWDVFILTHRFIGLPFIIGGKTWWSSSQQEHMVEAACSWLGSQ